MESFTREEQRAIERAHRADSPLVCPRCATDLDSRPVARPPTVSYVRHRTLVTCPGCGCHAAIDDD